MKVSPPTFFDSPPFFPVGSPARASVFPSRCFIEAPAVIADKQKSVMSNCPVVLGARRINYCASPAIISLVDLNTGFPLGKSSVLIET